MSEEMKEFHSCVHSLIEENNNNIKYSLVKYDEM